MIQKRHYTLYRNFLALIILLILLFPLYWMVITSLKPEQEVFASPPTLIPMTLNTESYRVQLEHGDFNMFRSFLNSVVIAFSAMVISVTLAVPASYGIGRFQFRGKSGVIIVFLVTQMLPVSVLLTPLFIMFKGLGFLASPSFLPTIIADSTIGLPFSVLILKNYFASVPSAIEEAALIDGCNRLTALVRVFIPAAFPGVIVCSVFSFLYAWGDLAYGLTFIRIQSLRPITAGIFNFLGQYGTKWSYLSAFGVVSIMPVVLIFIFMQKYIISGMISGAVKG
jgi:multiple sugar transport system permease protein